MKTHQQTQFHITPSIYSHTYLCVQAVGAEVQERAEVLCQLEADYQSLAQFVSSGESARIKARLTQIGRYWEELKESVQQLDGQLEESSSHQQKFKMNLEEVNIPTDTLTVWCLDVTFTVLIFFVS